jgi:hypothetical protein
MNLLRAGWAVAGTLMVGGSLNAQGTKHPIGFEDMMKLHRVSAPQVGGICRSHAGHGSEPEREQRVDRELGGRRSDAGYAERP